MYYESEGIGLVNLTIPEITYYDGVWSSPYFDCGGGNIWMMTYTVPFFSYNRFSQKYHFKGTAGIDIDLYKMDINQCPNQSNSSNYNIFANTAKCKYETTYCENLLGFKFKRGSYRCVCKKGYYVQHVKDDVENEKINKNYFDGKQMEELFQLYQNDEYGEYYNSFNCLPCEMSCEECLSKKSCTVKINWTLRLSITIVHIVVGIIIIVCCTHFTIKFRKHDILKAASPELLYLILAGSVLLYLPGIINYFPLYYHQVCNLKVWIRKIGFSVTYGSLLLKSWRIVKIFFIRSAVVIKITNYKLYKMLCVILLVMSLYLCIRTFYGGSTIILVKKLNKQHTFQCSHTFWHYIDSLLELIILFYGITLCIQLRKIPSKFNESQYISWIIYNQTLSSLCLEMLT
ncbi:hypothetical protein A3Q56_02353 [Intoshia linei]|uniref:G-protein coupled receptors family 3 profile domain-containing protein n=1 Tax=Intoshia linei TaxID=1819745 RepID=A0A177B6I7_9BILA|nr:hypothetical protein A3Q56_02353 [Intoshia linei]